MSKPEDVLTSLPEIGFYHLTQSRLEPALVRLLGKVLAGGHRAVLRVPGGERLEALDRALWTEEPASFLPHGARGDAFPERQPIWLTTGTDRPNGADVLLLVDAAPHEALDDYDRVLDLFIGTDAESLAAARARWRTARERGHRLVYWQEEGRSWRRAGEHPGPVEALPAEPVAMAPPSSPDVAPL